MTPHDSTINETLNETPAMHDDSYGYKAMKKPLDSNTGRGSLLVSNRKTNAENKPSNDYEQQKLQTE